MKNKLDSLVNSKTIASYVFEKQTPSLDGDTKFRLVDKLIINFNNGEVLKLETFCSGCLENTSLVII